MTWYLNGKEVIPKEHQSMQDALCELGVSKERQHKLISEAVEAGCCDMFMTFDDVREENIDAGTGELMSISINTAILLDEKEGFLYEWIPLRYCPFCGRPLFRKLLEEWE